MHSTTSSRTPPTPTPDERPGCSALASAPTMLAVGLWHALPTPTAATAITLQRWRCCPHAGPRQPDSPTPSSSTTPSTRPQVRPHSTSTTTPLPGSGKPPVTIGDKNFTEQFILGELYGQALEAQGYTIVLNRNIGPTEVTIQALESGRLDMYPEYLRHLGQAVAGVQRTFHSRAGAYRAGQRYALAHGLELLNATPFSNTDAIAVTRAYAVENDLRSLTDLRRVATTMTLGAPGPVPAERQRPAGDRAGVRVRAGLVQAAGRRRPVPGARPRHRAGGRCQHDRRPARRRRLHAAPRPRTRVRLGQRRARSSPPRC